MKKILAIVMICLILSLPFVVADSTVENEDLDSAYNACLTKNEESSSFANSLDSGMISALENVAAISYTICQTVSAMDQVINTIASIVGMLDGKCCKIPMEVLECQKIETRFNKWKEWYKPLQGFCCVVNCGWCTGGGCGKIGGVDMSKVSLGAISRVVDPSPIGSDDSHGVSEINRGSIDNSPGGIGQFHLSPYDNIYTAVGCMCPTAILFNIRKLRTIYNTYDCCVEQSCALGQSTTECEHYLDTATCMYWEGSIYMMLVNVALSFAARLVAKLIPEIIAQNKMVSCLLGLLDIWQTKDVWKRVQAAVDWVKQSFSEPTCEDLGFEKLNDIKNARKAVIDAGTNPDDLMAEKLDEIINRKGFYFAFPEKPLVRVQADKEIGYFVQLPIEDVRRLVPEEAREKLIYDEDIGGTIVLTVSEQDALMKYPDLLKNIKVDKTKISMRDMMPLIQKMSGTPGKLTELADIMGPNILGLMLKDMKRGEVGDFGNIITNLDRNGELISFIDELGPNFEAMFTQVSAGGNNDAMMGLVKKHAREGTLASMINQIGERKFRIIMENMREKRSTDFMEVMRVLNQNPEQLGAFIHDIEGRNLNIILTQLKGNDEAMMEVVKDHARAGTLAGLINQIGEDKFKLIMANMRSKKNSDFMEVINLMNEQPGQLNRFIGDLQGNNLDIILSQVRGDGNTMVDTVTQMSRNKGDLIELIDILGKDRVNSLLKGMGKGPDSDSIDIIVTNLHNNGELGALINKLGGHNLAGALGEGGNREIIDGIIDDLNEEGKLDDFIREVGFDNLRPLLDSSKSGGDSRNLDIIEKSIEKGTFSDLLNSIGADGVEYLLRDSNNENLGRKLAILRKANWEYYWNKNLDPEVLDAINDNAKDRVVGAAVDAKDKVVGGFVEGGKYLYRSVNPWAEEPEVEEGDDDLAEETLSGVKDDTDNEEVDKDGDVLDQEDEDLYVDEDSVLVEEVSEDEEIKLDEEQIRQLKAFIDSLEGDPELKEAFVKFLRGAINSDELQEMIIEKQKKVLEERLQEFVTERARYELAWQLLSLTLGKFAYEAIAQKCEDDWKASNPDSPGGQEYLAPGVDPYSGEENMCDTIGDKNSVTANLKKSGDSYEYGYTISACKSDIDYVVILEGSIRTTLAESRLSKGNSNSYSARIISNEEFNKICVSWSPGDSTGEDSICYPIS